MAKTVDEGFDIFLGWLTPLSTETNAAKSHRASILQCLKSNFKCQRFFRTGSFGNGTSVSGFSDVDYFASIPRAHITQNSISFLVKVKTALDTRFPFTGVSVRTPAILLPFGSSLSEQTEIVPADYMFKKNNFSVYDIADGNGGWIKASPEAHNTYVAYVDSKLSQRVKPLVRFIKAWKYYQNVPISSFYLELRVAKYALSEKAIVYPLDVRNIFRYLLAYNLPAIRDPMEVSGLIHACATEAQKGEALSKLATAYSRAQKAVVSEHNNRIKDAFHWWNLLYSDCFPSYG